jgi:hypothetical protein
LYIFSEFFGVMDIPDLHQKAMRAEKNFENTKVVSVDPALSRRLGGCDCGNEMIKYAHVISVSGE